ncbi:MAG: transglycosylase domain-containing protein [Bacilli bacterium]|nr:transglycosylase domain-containing protein [Bacilli bacterium]
MKDEINRLKVFLTKEKFNLTVLIISVVILIIGGLVFNYIISFILFILTNLIWIIPYLKWRKKLNERKMVKSGKKRDILNESSDKMSKKVKSKPKKKSVWKKILLAFLIFVLVGLVGIIGFCFYVAGTAGKFDPNKLYSKEASKLLDSKGEIFAKLGSEMRQKINYNEMSEELINAIIATEDSRFFEHNGFDLPRFLKASFGQAMGQNAGGASTLTMQVSKNQFTSTNSSGIEGIKRKFTDIYISMFQIEKNYSKEQIIEFYANSYYLGSGAYGVEQAAQTYFNKKASELNVSEAAMIAGMFQSPVAFDPNINPEKTEARRKIVLSLMKRHGYINNEEYKIAKKMTVDKIVAKGQSAASTGSEFQGFIDTVAEEVEEKTGFNPYSYSMKIHTTMDRDKQKEVNAIMKGEKFDWENDKVEAGVIALDTKTGAIVAVGSGRNKTGARSRNNATQIKRQIGSTAKPMYDYGPAIEFNNWNPSHMIIDDPYSYSDGTEINNWDGGYKGMMTIRQALIESRNIPALKTFQSVKNATVKDFVQSIGLSPEVDSTGFIHEAHAIGGYTGESPMTVAGAYETFANGGYYVKPYSFTKIEFDKNKKTYENNPDKKQVMSPETAYMVTNMLIDTGKNALGNYSNVNGAQFGAKTGTTNFDKKTLAARGLPSNAVNDLWVAGISPDYTIAVWYGYEVNTAGYYNRFGSSQNSRLFQAVAKNFFNSSSTFARPDGLVEVEVEQYTGTPLLPSANTPSTARSVELFKASAKPTETSARFNTLNNVTDLKATSSGNTITLNWKEIGTPEALNSGYWKPYVDKAFSVTKDQNSYLSQIMGYNSSVLGSVIYNVYQKSGGGLNLVASVPNGSATIRTSSSTSNPTYVVKASYSAFPGAESSGTEITVDHKGATTDDLKVSPANYNIDWTTGSNFNHNPKDKVRVTLKGEDVTSNVKFNIGTITDKTTQKTATINDLSNTAGTYLVTYTGSYDGIDTPKIEVTVTVKEKN